MDAKVAGQVVTTLEKKAPYPDNFVLKNLVPLKDRY